MERNMDNRNELNNQSCSDSNSNWHLWEKYSALVLLTILMLTPAVGIFYLFIGMNSGIPKPVNPNDTTYVSMDTVYQSVVALGVLIWFGVCIWMSRSIVTAAENDQDIDPVWKHFVTVLKQMNPFTKPKQRKNDAENKDDQDAVSLSTGPKKKKK